MSSADEASRRHAVDPARNVVLEASAGTGKTRVLVERYVNLLRAGIEPDNILAITFTRKAAAEMRERIIERLREAARLSELDTARWRELKGRLGDIAISTIDAFCLSLLREFPLEADVDPGFDLADDTEAPRLVAESLDRALRICRGLARDDEGVALVFAQLGDRRLRTGLKALLDRRLVAPRALARFLARGPRTLTAAGACVQAAARLIGILGGVPGGLDRFLDDGPMMRPSFAMFARDLRSGFTGDFANRSEQAAFRVLIDRLRTYFLKQDGRPRGPDFGGTGFKASDCVSAEAWKRHRKAAGAIAPVVEEAIRGFRRDLNVVQSRGLWRIYAVALAEYQQTLDSHALLDFSGVLERAIKLLQGLDEFAESRFRLEARYRHVLVDEFQDTSRAQWELVSELVRSWGQGSGAGDDSLPPSIFIVGDRKQSIYGFRDAEVAVLDEAAQFVEALRPGGESKHAISVSFRARPALLAFVNDLFGAVVAGNGDGGQRPDTFRYEETDRFPIDQPSPEASPDLPELGVVCGDSLLATADGVAEEVVRLLATATVRDRLTGLSRPAKPADIAILFRSRDSHREFEKALRRRGVLTYVYKGLGFFEADEVQDIVVLLKYLAEPTSDLRAAAFLRSRLVRLSDVAVRQLASRLADAITGSLPPAADQFSAEDRRVLELVREAVPQWLLQVDRATPAELLSAILAETAYTHEMSGPGWRQARENVKKLRAIVRRFQNRGYATMARVAEHLDETRSGDESNASIDAADSVSLMTVHASKGLEFPIVFVVNMGRGTGNMRPPVRVVADVGGEPSVAIADYQSEADEDVERRDREETKRLLYVALTRARDRLYLSATIQDGRCRMGRGSLGEVLPESLKALFVEAATRCGEVLTWSVSAGRAHELVSVPPADRTPRGDRTSCPPLGGP